MGLQDPVLASEPGAAEGLCSKGAPGENRRLGGQAGLPPTPLLRHLSS